MTIEHPTVPKPELGWAAEPFVLKDPSGKEYDLAHDLGKRPVVLAFICNHCPYVHAIVRAMVADLKQLQDEGVAVYAVMSNDYRTYTDDSPVLMQDFAKRFGFTFPYLVDETQAVARVYDAVCTPEFFGINAQGVLRYRGRLDDSRATNNQMRDAELVDAMRLISQTGSSPQKQFSSMGCSIKWHR
jgi:peroxiredoxin